MSQIINPTATISLGAPLPSDPTKAAGYALPLDPVRQGVRSFTPEDLGIAIWVLTANIVGLHQRMDRLERLAVGGVPDAAGGLEFCVVVDEITRLANTLSAEVGARREAEAKARAERELAGGVQ